MSTYVWVDANRWFGRIGDRGILGCAVVRAGCSVPVRNNLNRCHVDVDLPVRFTLFLEAQGKGHISLHTYIHL